MYLRCNRRFKDGKEHCYWNIVESKRCADGRVVQRQVLYLGEINDSQHEAWCRVIEVFDEDTRRRTQLALFPVERELPEYAKAYSVQVRLDAMQLHRPRQWGACWLAGRLYEQLGLDHFWQARLPDSREGTRWRHILQTLGVYRLLDPGSEWRLHRSWFEQSAMADLLGADYALVEKNALYCCLDKLLPHKRALFHHLTKRWQDLFGVHFDLLLYDLTSTYFESPPPQDEKDKRRFGYSRDKRRDCVQVVIALIVTPEGFPIAYEVLAGNTADKTTLKMFLQKIEMQYGKAERIWVMDRGIPTEDVLEDMRTADPPVYYLVGTPRGRLTKLERDLLPLPWQAVRAGVSVKLLPQDGELYVFAESRDRIHKERAMRQLKGLVKRLKQLQQMKFNDTAAQAGRGQGALSGRLAADRGRVAETGGLKDPAPTRDLRCHEPTDLLLPARSPQAATGVPARGALLTAHQSVWAGSGGSLAVLPPAHRGRGGVQKPQGRSATAPHLPSTRKAHRSAYLPRLHGLLPAHHLAGATQAVGTGSHLACRARQARQHPDARCPPSDHRWPHLELESLHRTQPGPATLTGTAWPHPATATAPANHRRRPTRALTRPSPFVV